MNNTEHEDQVLAAFLDLQALHGHQTFNQPSPSESSTSSLSAPLPRATVAETNVSQQSTTGPQVSASGNEEVSVEDEDDEWERNNPPLLFRTASFQDIHMSVGASTLAMDVESSSRSVDGSENEETPRDALSESHFHILELHHDQTAGTVEDQSQDLDPTTSVHEQDTALAGYFQSPDALGIQLYSTFTQASQVPSPLNLSPRSESASIDPLEGIIPHDERHNVMGRGGTPTEPHYLATDQSPETHSPSELALPSPAQSITSNDQSRYNSILHGAPEELPDYHRISQVDHGGISGHPGVRVPLRGPNSRLSSIVASTNMSIRVPSHHSRDTAGSAPDSSTHQQASTVNETPSQGFCPPDGGYQAWMQVLGAFFVNFNVWGLVLSYGAMLAYYRSVLLPEVSYETFALVGSLQPGLIFLCASLFQQGLSRGYFQLIFRLGSALYVLCLFILSFWTTKASLLLVQGVGIGIGMSMVFNASEDLLTTYFAPNGNLGLALALSRCGIVPGALVFISVIKSLTIDYDFAWAMRTHGLVALLTMLLANILLHPRSSDQRPRPTTYQMLPTSMTEVQAVENLSVTGYVARAFRSVMVFRMLPFWLLCLGLFLASLGALGPFYLIVAQTVDIGHLSGFSACDYLLAMVVPILPGFTLPPVIMFKQQYREPSGSQSPGNSAQPSASNPSPTNFDGPLTTPRGRPRSSGLQDAVDARTKAAVCIRLISLITTGLLVASIFNAVRACVDSSSALFAFNLAVALGVGPFLGTTSLILHKLCHDFPASNMRAIMRMAGAMDTQAQIRHQSLAILAKSVAVHVLMGAGFVLGGYVSGRLVTVGQQTDIGRGSNSVVGPEIFLPTELLSMHAVRANANVNTSSWDELKRGEQGYEFAAIFSGSTLLAAFLVLFTAGAIGDWHYFRS